MLTLFPNLSQSIPELAASLTDKALEIVGRVTARGDSVETELKLWRVLTAELKQELRGPRSTDAPLIGTLQRVVNRAALRVIAERSPISESRTVRSHQPEGCLCQV